MEAADSEEADRNLSAIDPHDGHTWRSGVRSTIRAASQILRRGRGGGSVDAV